MHVQDICKLLALLRSVQDRPKLAALHVKLWSEHKSSTLHAFAWRSASDTMEADKAQRMVLLVLACLA